MSFKLTPSFLDDLFSLLYRNQTILQICSKHLKYEYIPKELVEYKLILKSIFNQYNISGKLPSIGITSQQYSTNADVQEALAGIKETNIPEDIELMINQLQDYIKNVRFQLLNEQVVDLYQKGEQERAIQLSAEESNNIIRLSLREEGGKFSRIFGDFEHIIEERQIKSNSEKGEKVPFFIDPIDDVTFGGFDEGDTALWILRSGVGKSTALKWTGLMSAMLGFDVLHIQLEGSKAEAEDKYTQIWLKTDFVNIKKGDLPENIRLEAQKTLDQMKARGRDVFVYAFEKFGEASMIDVRELVLEYEKIKGKFPHLIIIDSLDLLITGTNKKIDSDPAYKKEKMQKVAQLMKDIAIEFKTRILTATQTGDVSPVIWDDETKVLTRSNTEGDRTLVKPFSYVFTFNQTSDEMKAKIGRIYIDKLRNYSPKDQVYPICTSFDRGAFYDKSKTIKKYYNN